jgi:arsenite-transporting ATPase
VVPRDEFFEAIERLYGDVEDVRQILLDGDRTTARLVVNPARVVIEETRRSFAYLSLYGVATDAVVVNRLLPEAAAGGYLARWAERERDELDSIAACFPIPQFRAPLYPRELRGIEDLGRLARDVFGDRDPAAVFTRSRPIRLVKRAGRTRLEVDLPGVSKEEIDVAARGPDLVVQVRNTSRWIALPTSVQGRPIRRARLREGVLEVEFG